MKENYVFKTKIGVTEITNEKYTLLKPGDISLDSKHVVNVVKMELGFFSRKCSLQYRLPGRHGSYLFH